MNKTVLLLLVLPQILFCSEEPDCVTPTDYIMQFLPKSTTCWIGSEDWKNGLDNQNQLIRTVFAKTHLMEYHGISAAFLRLKETGIQGFFEITRKGDVIEVESTIKDIEIRHATNEQEIAEFRRLAAQYNKHETEQSDRCSCCKFVTNAVFDEQNKTLKATLNSTCKSTIPYKEFMEKMHEHEETL